MLPNFAEETASDKELELRKQIDDQLAQEEITDDT